MDLPEEERHRLSELPAEQMLADGWTVRPQFYHPRTGEYVERSWVHVERGIDRVAVHQRQLTVLAGLQIPGARHHEGHFYEGEHENNGPSWAGPGPYADEPGAWSFGVREIYEFIDPALPYNKRFRTLRYELQISRAGDDDPYNGDRFGVVPLSAERWYALAEMALSTGQRATAAGL